MHMLLRDRDGDNWAYTYPNLCAERGLRQESDEYLHSLFRCQVFRRDES
ncbi:MAG: hypothetical protein SWK76_17745 [Actinomycetota bacterium]|nr:hypothetical protein [Actinomycetota bacterium]